MCVMCTYVISKEFYLNIWCLSGCDFCTDFGMFGTVPNVVLPVLVLVYLFLAYFAPI